MTIRKWTILTISTLAALILALIFTVNILVDPYGEFGLIKGNYNRLKFKTLKSSALNVASKLNNGKYTLVFGSSRTMLISEEILGEPVLNFSTSIYNNPGDILAFLENLEEEQVKNIKQIYYLIDINSFHYQSSAPELASKQTLFMERLRNIGPTKIEDAWDCVSGNLKPESEQPNYIDEFGVLNKKDTPYKNNVLVFNSHFVSKYYLDNLAEINSFCTSKQIKIIFFTLPWNKALNAMQQSKLNSILRSVIFSCSMYYDHYGAPDFTGNKTLFADVTHLNSAGLKKLFNGPYWTKDNLRRADGSRKPPLSLKEMKKDAFLQYIEKYPELVDIDFIDQLHKSGRNDLVMVLCDGLIPVDKLIGDCFFLNKMSLVKMILSSGKDFNRSQLTNDISLHYAIMSGLHSSVRDALLLGADINNEIASTSPLLRAIQFTKSTDMIELLLKNGANINYVNKHKGLSPDYGKSVFTLALAKKDQKQLDFLFEYAPDSPLAEHARLVRELRRHSNNATAYKKYTILQDQYYVN